MAANHDAGPFYLTPIERARQKFDKCLYKDKEVVLKKDELVVELKRKGCMNPKGNKEKIEELCRAFNIPLKK
jgi:hypothetical protein